MAEFDINSFLEKARNYEPLFSNDFVIRFYDKSGKILDDTVPSHFVTAWNFVYKTNWFTKSKLYINLNQSRDIFIVTDSLKEVSNIEIIFIDKQYQSVSGYNFNVKFHSLEMAGNYSESEVLKNFVIFTIKKVSSNNLTKFIF